MANEVREGIGVSPGIVIGTALVVERGVGEVPERQLKSDEVDAELDRFESAVGTVRAELLEAEERAGREIGEGIAQIFDAQKMILDDRSFLGPVRARIRDEHDNAERAIKTVETELRARFARIDDPYLRDRGVDIQSLSNRLLRILLGQAALRLDRLESPVIVVAHDLSPAETSTLDREHVLGFATDTGGRTSHTAIMARSLEIPAVVGTHDATLHVRTGDTVVLDGNDGLVIVNPDAATRARQEARREAFLAYEARLATSREEPSVTPDGAAIALLANVESAREAVAALRHGAQGVGLFRSEFLYLRMHPHLPDEEAHFEEYRATLDALAPAPVTIRTLDLGGDKSLSGGLKDASADEGLLGVRGIRYSLRHRDLFRVQLRGLLRASAHGDLRVVLPFVTEIPEVIAARELIDEVAGELRAEGHAVAARVPLGAMLEVPAATLIADHLADHVDFFCVGTNDLIQYLLAVDRANDAVTHLYEPLHPGVLQVLRNVIDVAQARSIPVTLCGEVAADPLTAMVYMGLGIDHLSMAPSSIPVIKSLVRRLPLAEGREIAEHVLGLASAQEVEKFALDRLMAHLPEGFVAG